MSRGRVAVIGGGIFGTSAAIELAEDFDVAVFERASDVLLGATYANHNRHHYGFHYPRSPETLLQCQESREAFESAYGACLDWDFDNYYCVAKEGSRTSADAYIEFCRKHGLRFESVAPPEGVIDASKVAACLKVREGVYNIETLRRLVRARLGALKSVSLRLGEDVVGGSFGRGDTKTLKILRAGRIVEESFDFAINATYAHTNRFCGWFGFPKRSCQFNLQELDVIELPISRRVGVTVQDGNFPSFIPIAGANRYLLAHVVHSQLVREISDAETPLLARAAYVESNWRTVLDACADYLPILRRATYVRSIFVDRVVDSARLADDSRVTEITSHGKGCWSVFSAKVITCVTTARKLRALVADAARVA